ncbi:IPT/TIG domain-containing protein [Mucilaginibacter sp. AW1-3]
MKKLNIMSKNLYWILSALIALSFASCKKDSPNLIGGTGAPTIDGVHTVYKSVVDSSRITTTIIYNSSGVPTTTTNPNYNPQVVAFDSLVTSGRGGSQYRITGTNLGSTTNVYFNGVAAYFNPAVLADNSIIVTLPTTAPFNPGQAATLTVVTLHGSVDYKFTVVQPPPQIVSFTPVAASVGDTIYINGTVFDNATSVKFGTVAAKIVGNTSTQLKVLLPAGVVQAFITVTTAGGSTTSANSFGYKYIIFDDARATGWGGNGGGYSGYTSTIDFNNSSPVERGSKSIAVTFQGSYGALQIGYGGSAAPNVTTLGLKSIKFFVYGGNGIKTGDKLQVVINGNYNGTTVVMTAGAWVSCTVPLSSLMASVTGTINEVVLQSQGSAVPSTIYVDDLGFI